MQDRFSFSDYMSLLVIFLLGLAVRAGYLHWGLEEGKGPAWRVQGDPTQGGVLNGHRPSDHDRSSELDKLVENLHDYGEFKVRAPLAKEPEITAHVAPGYFWIYSQVRRLGMDDEAVMRWGQVGLGSLTVVCYFLFARRAFGSRRVAFVTGLGAALHPFWILNTVELQDGVLATFALSVVLVLGTRGSQSGGALTGLMFGLSLAGLVMVRASFLPFSLVALIWYLLSCRKQSLGWLCAVLACLGYAMGINPWLFRDYQAFGEPVPVVTSTFLHLWMGNHPKASGAGLNEEELEKSLSTPSSPARYQELLAEKYQSRRYNMLARDVLDSITSDPKGTCDRRVQSALAFLFGKSYFLDDRHLLAEPVHPLSWLDNDRVQTLLIATLLVLFLLGFVGWRLSMVWRQQSRMAALALFWVPLPYILSHAEMFSGPRLPLDGVLLCLAAYALVGFEKKKKAEKA